MALTPEKMIILVLALAMLTGFAYDIYDNPALYDDVEEPPTRGQFYNETNYLGYYREELSPDDEDKPQTDQDRNLISNAWVGVKYAGKVGGMLIRGFMFWSRPEMVDEPHGTINKFMLNGITILQMLWIAILGLNIFLLFMNKKV